MSFERNKSPKTPREIEAEGLSRKLSESDRRGDINLGYPRYVDAEVAQRWPEEGYGRPETFVDEAGNPIVIARREDPAMYDDTGSIKPGIDVAYRVYLEEETREVLVPKELAGRIAQALDRGDIALYKVEEGAVLELILRPDAVRFDEDLAWLRAHFGDSLMIVRPALSTARLDTDEKVIGISLGDFPAFSESDF